VKLSRVDVAAQREIDRFFRDERRCRDVLHRNASLCSHRTMIKNSDKKNLVKWNTILWIAAMVLPAFLSLAFASTKFPWPMILPLLLMGPMLASNKMLTQAIGDSADARKPD
jgi:hypothetical protein